MIAVSPQATVRAQARKALQHNYARAIAAMVIGMLPMYLIDTACVILMSNFRLFTSDANTLDLLRYAVIVPVSVAAGALLSPFFNGFVRVYYRNAFTGSMDLNDLFYYFEGGRYSRTLRLNLSFLLRLALPGILIYLPVAVFEFFSSKNGSFYGSVLYCDAFFLLTVMSTVILTLYSLKYFTVFTLNIEDETLSSSELFRTSGKIMRAQTGDAAKLIFSYTPWMLLCLTILPLLYVVPYMTQGLCVGAKWMTRAAYANEE